MPSRPIGGLQWVLFRVFGLGDMKEWSNDFWYTVSSGTISATTDFTALATAFYAAITPDWAHAITTNITIRGCLGYFNNGVGTYSIAYYSDVTGTGLSSQLPEDVAVIVRKETAGFTPSEKGRWYFVGPGTGDTVGSYLNTSGITDWTAFATALKGAVTAGGITLSPAHFSAKNALLYPISNTPVVALLGTRRRRRGPF